MSKVLSLIALTMLVFWAVGFFIFHINATIHILLIVAGMVLLVSLLYNKAFMRWRQL